MLFIITRLRVGESQFGRLEKKPSTISTLCSSSSNTRLHFEHLRLHWECLRPSMGSTLTRIQHFTLMRTRIRLAKMMRIWNLPKLMLWFIRIWNRYTAPRITKSLRHVITCRLNVDWKIKKPNFPRQHMKTEAFDRWIFARQVLDPAKNGLVLKTEENIDRRIFAP